jgi:hypothetical protein
MVIYAHFKVQASKRRFNNWIISGLLPLLQWIIISERTPNPNKYLQQLTRLENFCNLVYYVNLTYTAT